MKDFNKLLSAAGTGAVATELRQVASLLFYTGIRRGEIMHLEWSDIDFEKRCMRVTTKNCTQRQVPFGCKVHQILTDLAKTNAGARFVLGKSPSATLNRISARMHSLSGTSDGRRLTLYGLRRGFGERWMTAGGNVEGLCLVMGYSKPSTFKSFLPLDHAYAAAARFQSQLEDQEAI